MSFTFNGSIFLIVLINIISYNLYGQGAYLATDSSMSFGIKLTGGTEIDNAKFIKLEQGKKTIEYTPNDIKEYGLKDGRVYFSKQIEVNSSPQKVFLERLNEGKIALYYYKNKHRKSFYIEKDSSKITKLNRKDTIIKNGTFREELSVLLEDCDKINDGIKVTSYGKKSLSQLIRNYNLCRSRPLPFFKVGFSLGLNATILNSPTSISDEILKDASFNTNTSFSMGVFCDIPLYVGSFYFHPEAYYYENAFSYNLRNEDAEYDVVINTSSINIPLLLRYAIPMPNLRPYANIGCIYSQSIKNENALYQSQITNNIIEIRKLNNSDILSKKLFGFSMGLGFQYDLNYRKSISIEIRYNKLYPIGSVKTLDKSILNLLLSLYF